MYMLFINTFWLYMLFINTRQFSLPYAQSDSVFPYVTFLLCHRQKVSIPYYYIL